MDALIYEIDFKKIGESENLNRVGKNLNFIFMKKYRNNLQISN